MSKLSFLFKYLFLILFILAIGLSSCKTKAPVKTIEPITTTAPKETEIPIISEAPKEELKLKEELDVVVMDSLPCRLMVQFISTGGGINNDARLALERYQMKFSMEENLPLRPRRIPKGREGEVDYCYPMYGFTPEKSAEFITGLRKIMEKMPLVIISENTAQPLY